MENRHLGNYQTRLKSQSVNFTMSFSMEPTTQEKNKQIVARYSEEFWGKGNLCVVDELCADDVLSNYPMHGPRRGKEAVKQMLAEFKEVSPETHRN